MNFKFLENFPDPFFDILEIQIPKNLEDQLVNENIREIAELCPFPRFIKSEIPASKLRFSEIHSYTTVMHMLEYVFSFFPQQVTQLIQIQPTNENDNLYCLLFALHSYNTWITLNEKTNSLDFLPILMKFLIKFIQTDYSELITNAIFRLAAIYLKNSNFNDISTVILYLRQIYSEKKDIHPSGLYLIAQIIHKLIDRNTTYLTRTEIGIIRFYLEIINRYKSEKNKSDEVQITSKLVMEAIKNQFFNLDLEAIQFYASLSENFDQEFALEYAIVGAQSIVKVVNENDWNFEFLYKSEIQRLDFKRTILPVAFKFPSSVTFPDGFQISKPNIFDTEHVANLESYTLIAHTIEYIIVGIRQNSEIMKKFIKYLSKNLPQGEKSNFSLNVLVYACCLLSKRTTIPHFFMKYLPIEKIFAPGIYCTLENCKDNIFYQHTNQLRNATFHVIVKEGVKAFDNFMGLLLTTPIIFAESMYRLTHYTQEVLKWAQESPDISKNISDYLLNMALIRKLNIKEANMAITSIFVALMFLFTNMDIQTLFYQEEYFTSCFISHIFDFSLSSYILNQVKVYMSTCDLNNSELGNKLTEVISLLCVDFPKKENVILVSNIAKVIHDVLLQKQTEVQIFEQIINKIRITAFSSLQKTEECRQCFRQCIDLFIVAHEISSLHIDDLVYFEKGIQLAFDIEHTSSLFPNFVQFLAGEARTTTDPNFIIKEPLVLRLMLDIYEKNSKLAEMCKYIEQICKFDTENCIICHNSNFDLFILDKINSKWQDKDSRADIIVLLDLFAVIAQEISSALVVHRYVSLLCPINGFLPPFYSMAIDKMLVMFELVFKNPPELLELAHKKKTVTQTVLINEDISFAFWLKMTKSTSEYYPIIFSAADAKRHHFSIYVNSKCLSIGNEEMGLPTLPYLIENSWNFILVHFVKNEKVLVTINSNQPEEIILQPQMRLIGETKFVFGDELSTSRRKDSEPYVLGPFGAFTGMKAYHVTELETHGYIYMRRIDAKPVFIYNHQDHQKQTRPNFVYVLTNICHIDIILPIFKNFALKYEDGTLCENHNTYATELLINFLLWGDNSESSYAEMNAFSVIGLLIESVDINYINFEFYLHFFSVLGTINYKPLKSQIISEILMRFSLWCRIDPAQQMLIYSHWSQLLIEEYKENVMNVIDFSKLMTEILIYFRVDTKDKTMEIFPTPQSNDEHRLSDIRSMLLHLLLVIANYKFTYDDFMLIVSAIKAYKGTNLCYELVDLIHSLAAATPSPFDYIKEKDIITPLLGLVDSSDMILVEMMIPIIIYIYKVNKMTSPSLQYLIYVMIRLVPNEKVTIGLTHRILFELEKYNELYSFFFWCLYSLDGFHEEIFEKGVNVSYTSSIWPFLLMKKSPNPEKIIRKAILCDSKNILKSYIYLDQACRVINMKRHKMKRLFMIELIQAIQDKAFDLSNEIMLMQFCSIIEAYFFLNGTNHISHTLQKAFENSPFNFSEKSGEAKKEGLASKSSQLILTNLLELEKISSNANFGLHLKKDGIWEDVDLAVKCLQSLLPHISKVYALIVFLIYFIANCKLNVEKDFLKTIIKRITQLPNFSSEDADIIKLASSKFIDESVKSFSINEESINTMQSILENAATLFVNNYNIVLSGLQTFISECDIKLEQYMKEIVKITNENWFSNVNKYVDSYKTHNAITQKQWRYIWSMLTIPRAPWEGDSKMSAHMKRDNTLCNFLFPAKLKRNWNFDSHEIASKARITSLNPEIRMKPGRIPQQKTQQMFLIKSDEKLLYESNCTIITITTEKTASIALYNSHINISSEKSPEANFEYSKIYYCLPKMYLHLNIAFEFCMNTGVSVFVVLPNEIITKSFLKIIDSKMTTESRLFTQRIISDQITNEWIEHKISNFKYLLFVNMKGSRSFNSASQYPIFPWVIRDFASENLDFDDKSIYRDMSKPVGAFSETRLAKLKELYADFKVLNIPAQLYSWGPICSAVLYIYLIRVEPFTTMHIEFQSGRFDSPNRLFSSISQSFKTVVNESNDYRELIPEFFFMSEFLENKNNFDLGLNNGNVELPKWAKTPFDFIYLHRKALESEYVSQTINNWIDLLFGYKQKGKDAIDANNIYLKDLLDDVWTPENLSNLETKTQIENSKSFLGQLPRQVFTKPHPQRQKFVKKEINKQIIDVKIKPVYVQSLDGKMYYLLTSDGSAFEINVNGEKKKTVIEDFDYKNWCSKGFLRFGAHRVITSGDVDRIINLKTGEVIELCYSVKCSNGNDNYLVAISDKNSLHFYDTDSLEVLKTVPIYRESAKCCYISSEFHLAVIASRDGSLVLHTLGRDTDVTSMELGEFIPQNVIVTPCWGFIVCVAVPKTMQKTTTIFLFSVNGEQIRKVELDFEIVSMTCFRSRNGFDYIIIVNTRGVVMVAEAYYLNFKEINLKYLRISNIAYDEENSTINCFIDSGQLMISQYDPEF